MITAAILRVFAAVAGSLMAAIPSLPVPSWLSGSDSALATVFNAAGSLSVWFPTALVLTVVLAVLAAHGISFLIKVGRMVLSLFTGGGGSSA